MAFAGGDGRRKWSKLPPAILRSISLKVTDIVDYVQFRSVCRSWRSAAKPSDLPPQHPRLLFPRDADRASEFSFFDLSGYDDPLRSLYGLPLDKISTFSSPETLSNRAVCGSSFGWLALFNSVDSSLALWNPFTRALISLPPLPTCCPALDPTSESELNPLKVSLSSSPSDAFCIVIAFLQPSTTFCFCRVRGEKWLTFDSKLHLPLVSAQFHEGILYAFDHGRHGMMMGKDSSSNFVAGCIAPPVGIESLRLAATFVVKADTELLMVVNFVTEAGHGVKLFRFDLLGEGSKWEPLDSIGDRAIFLSWNDSCIVRARDVDGCEEDSIYFSSLNVSCRKGLKDGVYYIDIYSLKERRFRPLSCRWMSNAKGRGDAAWLVPALC